MTHRVLLVDDEEDFVEVLAERMETRGLRVDVATSGEQALEKIDEKPFDAIVLDVSMPGMDGIEALEKMREKNPELQVILLTGHATLEKGIKAMKLGAVDFMEKPADFQTLVDKIDVASDRSMDLAAERIDREMAEIMRKKGW